jgi:hypothetical protein
MPAAKVLKVRGVGDVPVVSTFENVQQFRLMGQYFTSSLEAASLSSGARETRLYPGGLFYDLFNLADFLLDFPVDLFIGALGFEVRFVESVPDFLFHCTFCFMDRALNFVFRAFFHAVSPLLPYSHLSVSNSGTETKDD